MVSALLLGLSIAPNYYRGVDASFIPEYRDLKTEFFDGSQRKDALEIFAKNGINLLRLRVWVNPEKGYCDLSHTLTMAKDAKTLGMDLLIDFHYSDWWADPGNQTPPKKWKDYNLDQMCSAVEAHTIEVLTALRKQGTPAKFVAVGNEIRPGMLWPLGKIVNNDFTGLAKLLKAGVKGVRIANKGIDTKIQIHNDAGGNWKDCYWFYKGLQDQGVEYDDISISYYPWWHGGLNGLEENMMKLSITFDKPVWICETAYPFSLKYQDEEKNFVGEEKQLLPGYPATPEGQAKFLAELHRLNQSLPNNKGRGVIYWAPEYVAVPGMKTPYENLTLFDFDRRALPGLRSLGQMRS